MKKHFMVCIICLHFSCSWAVAGPFFSDDFEAGDLSHVENGVSWTVSNSSPTDNVTVSNEESHSGSYSLKFFFAGNADLSDDAWAEQRFTLGQQRDEIFMRYFIYFPTNYKLRETGGAENTKLWRLWGSDYGDPVKVGFSIAGPSMDMAFKGNVGGWPKVLDCSGSQGFPTDTPRWTLTDADLGRWISFEFHIRRDTGVGDGILQFYVDGKLIIDLQNQSWVGAPCNPGYFRDGYLMGWSNAGFNEDTSVYIDDVVFSTTYIGPGENVPVIPPSAPRGFQKE